MVVRIESRIASASALVSSRGSIAPPKSLISAVIASQSPESTRFCQFVGASEQPRRLHLGGLLEFEQELLALQPARIAGQLTVAPDHTVARDDDAQRIAADGLADLLRRRAVGECGGEFSVGDRARRRGWRSAFSRRGAALVAVWGDRQVEVSAVAGEVVGQLELASASSVGFRIDPRAERVLRRPMPVVPEVDAGERVASATTVSSPSGLSMTQCRMFIPCRR